MTRLDFLLLLMILIWGTNFSVVKVALRDFPEIGITFSFGAAMYILMMVPTLMEVNWGAVSGFSWFLMVASALLALNMSYWICIRD